MNLLDKIADLPTYEGAQARRRWSEFVAPYRELLKKGYPKAEACRVLGNLAGLNTEETARLYRAAKQWK